MDNENQNLGLLTGKFGLIYYYSQNKNPKDNLKNSIIVNKCIELYNLFINTKNVNFDFAEGLAGILFVIQNTKLRNHLHFDIKLQKYLNEKLLNIESRLLTKNNWDFLSGAIGVNNYFNSCNQQFYLKSSDMLFSHFASTFIEYEDSNYTWHSELYPNSSNLSLAHGIISILDFLIKYKPRKLDQMKHEILIRNCLNHLNKNKLENAISKYPSFIDGGNKPASRLAWCYGDLIISYKTLQAAMKLNDKELFASSIQIIDDTLKRREYEDTWVLDAGICHGSSGVAYLYHKLYIITQHRKYLKGSKFWLNKTYEILNNLDYKFINRHNESWENNYNLLEGLLGVALVINTINNKIDTNWDKCILL